MFAQISRPARHASLDGVVLGPDGKPVANAVVTYQSGGGDTPHAMHTDLHGRFHIVRCARDNYDLRASAHGKYSQLAEKRHGSGRRQEHRYIATADGAEI